MPSSTSNSNHRIADRPWLGIWLAAMLISLGFLGAWEVYWRGQGFSPALKDDPHLWAMNRALLEEHLPPKLALIGASRIQQGLHLDSLRKKLGSAEPVQLAIPGLSPLPLLRDLAEDRNFHGTVLCDVTPSLLFVESDYGGPNVELWGKRMIDAYHRHKNGGRPAYSWMEDRINLWVQEHFVFAGSSASARTLSRNLASGSEAPTPPHWWVTRDRMQIADYSKIDVEAFKQSRIAATEAEVPASEEILWRRIQEMKDLVQTIQARGGAVIFLRLPSTGALREVERKKFPKTKYWNILAEHVGAPTYASSI